MNNRIQPYHFTKDIGNNFGQFFGNVVSCNGIICFDFEDSIGTADKQAIPFLKKTHRDATVSALHALADSIQTSRIGFRINGSHTDYYTDDLKAIATLESVNCVFLPKAESKLQIENLLEHLPANVQEIIAIIETQKGLENSAAILSVSHPKFRRIAFGHCDFNLSNSHFPFFHQDSEIYWSWIAALSASAGSAGKQLINSPVLDLDNSDYFTAVLQKNRLFENITGQVTLSYSQTRLCAGATTGSAVLSSPGSLEDRGQYAQQVIAAFERNQVLHKRFAVGEDRILISPQEYEQAKQILKTHHL